MTRVRRALRLTGVVALAASTMACDPPPPVPTFLVTTETDGSDADPGDGLCEMTAGAGDCSLRAAIGEANAGTGADLLIPAGTYELTVPDVADGDVDLDIVSTVKIDAGVTDVWIGAVPVEPFVAGPVQVDVHEGGSLTAHHLGVTGRVRVAGRLHLEQSAIGTGLSGLVDGALDVTPTGSATLGNSLVVGWGGTTLTNAGKVTLLYTSAQVINGTAVIATNGSGSTTMAGTAVVHGGLLIHGVVVDAPSATHCTGNAVTSLGHNFAMGTTCGLTDPGDIQGVNFGCSLATPCNFGTIQVHASSPVVDAIRPGTLGCGDTVVVDRKGAPRPADGNVDATTGCDIGETELQP